MKFISMLITSLAIITLQSGCASYKAKLEVIYREQDTKLKAEVSRVEQECGKMSERKPDDIMHWYDCMSAIVRPAILRYALGRLNWRPTFDRFLDLVAHHRCLCE